MSRSVLLTLLVPPALEDACVELLLQHPSTPPFSSVPARGHGEDPAGMSLSEQVVGWRREVRIEVLIAQADSAGLLADLAERLPTPTVRYRVTPVLESGNFGDGVP